MNMDTTTLIATAIAFFIVISLLKFIIKIPLYLIAFGTLAALGFAAYRYMYGM